MRNPIATPAALLFNDSLLITRPAARLRSGWLGLSVGLHLLAGGAFVVAPYFRFEPLERPSLEKKNIVTFGSLVAASLRGNGHPAVEKADGGKTPPIKDHGLKIPKAVQKNLDVTTPASEETKSPSTVSDGPGDDPNGSKDGVLHGKGDNDSLGLDPEGRSPIGTPGPPSIVKAYDLSDPPILVSHEEPVYPETARSQGVEGNVYLELVVDEYGRVIDARILRSDNAMFNASALASVKRWKYTAARADGRAVRTYKTVTMRFTLH